MAGEPHVEVSLSDIYQIVLETKQEVVKMRPVGATVKDHEGRLRRVEKTLWTMAAVLLATGSAAVKIVGA